LAQLRGDQLVHPSALDGDSQQEEPEQDGELVRLAQPPEIGGQLRRARQELVGGRQTLLDSRRLVPGDPEQTGELQGRLGALGVRRMRPAGLRF
jgi:hypothetical protein